MGSTRFCFLIDGLDEYCNASTAPAIDAHDIDHSELIDVVKLLSSNGGVKICVSSREWAVFENAFQQLDRYRLALQDFTIRAYILGNLTGHFSWPASSADNAPYLALVEDVATRAEGVFLWVHLVINSLRIGLNNKEPIALLCRRLDRFPPDLNKYYQRMLHDIEDHYRTKSSEMILVALATSQPLHPLMYAFLDDWRVARGPFLQTQPYRHSHDTYAQRLDTVVRELHICCQDILEIADDDCTASSTGTTAVLLMHRTARDYVNEAHVQELLKARLSRKFNAHAYIGAAGGAYLEILARGSCGPSTIIPDKDDRERVIKETVHEVMVHMHEVECLNGPVHPSILDNLQHASQRYDSSFASGRILPKITEEAIKWNLQSYVRSKMEADPEFSKHFKGGSGHLLRAAIIDDESLPQMCCDRTLLGSTNVRMANLLLAAGADPNEPYGWLTIWGYYLAHIYQEHRKMSKAPATSESARFLLIQDFLENGADPYIEVKGNPVYMKNITAKDVIREVFVEEDQDILLQLLQEKSKPVKPNWFGICIRRMLG